MTTTSVALVTIGQAPRPDLTTFIEAVLPPSVTMTQAGLLDGMSREDVGVVYAVGGDEMPLVTLLNGGHVVSISSTAAQRELQALIDRLVEGGVEVVVLLCTGQLPGLNGGLAMLIRPDIVVPAVVSALVSTSRIGVILPKHEQIGAERNKWDGVRTAPLFAAASPYDEDSSALEQAGFELVAAGAQLIVLDCMGYNNKHESALRKAVGLPVVVSNKVIAGVLSSLL